MMRAAILAAALFSAGAAHAVEPAEMLSDPALESRARAISKGLRCLVCRNENIDESNAPLARDLRVLLRERLAAGDADAEVRAFLVARFGEYVLLEPTPTGANLLLWSLGPAAAFIALTGAAIHIRRRARSAAEAPPLSEDEQARLARLLGE